MHIGFENNRPLSSFQCWSVVNEDFGSRCLLRLHPKPSILSWSSQAPCTPVCFSEKPFCVFQRSPSEQTTRWWTPLTSWSHVLLEAACLPKKELFSRRTLLTGRSLDVALQNSSRKVHGNVFVALMMSREEGEMLILRCGVVSGKSMRVGQVHVGSSSSLLLTCHVAFSHLDMEHFVPAVLV